MAKTLNIIVDELAVFMNAGWPGEDWYLADCADYLWETTFEPGLVRELYKPVKPGTMINLYDYEARVLWQGCGADPTLGRGHTLSKLFLDWRRRQTDVVVVAYVPPDKARDIRASLEDAGCMLLTAM
ncbi:MAG: hypothetical protein ABSH21_10360 [Verrucomicrobiia bacterium]|jgi:hypothetical protein